MKIWTNNFSEHCFQNLILSCPNLEYLELNDGIKFIPTSIWTLSKLKELMIFTTLNDSSFKFIIPKEISGLKSIEKLSFLFENIENPLKIVQIDPSINYLKSLKELTIVMNEYKRCKSFLYPDGIENLVQLKVLNLNTIKTMPKGIEKLTNLKSNIDIY